MIKHFDEAVTIRVIEAKYDLINGIYDPIANAYHCEWPMYMNRNKNDLIMFFNSHIPYNKYNIQQNIIQPGEWIIQHIKDLEIDNINDLINPVSREETYKQLFNIENSLIRLYSNNATFPELRVEGNYGITEFHYLNEKIVEIESNISQVEIVTEDFYQAMIEINEMKRLAAIETTKVTIELTNNEKNEVTNKETIELISNETNQQINNEIEQDDIKHQI